MLLTVAVCQLRAQDHYIPLAGMIHQRFEATASKVGTTLHTAIKPWRSSELRPFCNTDSILLQQINIKGVTTTKVGNRIFNQPLFAVSGDDFELRLNPVVDFSITREQEFNRNLMIFSRGLQVQGTIGKGFSFYSQFNENQNEYPTFIDDFIQVRRVVPGLTRAKDGDGKKDFAWASGTISYSLKKYFNFQFGHDKNFIGDGYRSMLLSDYAPNYPFLKINTTIWKIKYMNLYSVMQDINIKAPANYNEEDFSFRKKYSSTHYLSIQIGKHVTFGILEGVVWQHDSIRAKGFDINYINPFIFFRPVEFSMGSADNAFMGFNLSAKLNSHHSIYAQLLIDDLNVKLLKSKPGYYGNKFAGQIGYKTIEPFKIKNLFFLIELNAATPYTYQHRSRITNYAHYNMELAHPLGGNFLEHVVMLQYQHKRIHVMAKNTFAQTGRDTGNVNFGSDVFKSYFTPYQVTGNKFLQGNRTKIIQPQLVLSYIINPSYSFRAFFSIANRMYADMNINNNSMFISFGIKTDIGNFYSDF